MRSIRDVGSRIRGWVSRTSKRRRAAALVVVLLAAGLGLSLRLDYLASLPAILVEELEGQEGIQRLLVIAPHCDDELISCGGLIQEVLSRGGQARVAIVTNGDGSFSGTMVELRQLYPTARDYIRAGMGRQVESLNAMLSLGLSEDDVVFLSYPDQGILPLWASYWDYGNPYRSPFTRLSSSPYVRTYNAEGRYCGELLLADLCSLMREFEPDTVTAPHPADIHRDHWATGAFAALATAMQSDETRPRFLAYLAHRLDYPLPRGLLPFAPLLPPLRLLNDTSLWGKVTLPDELVEAKGQAVELYRSQLRLLGDFLRSFVRQNELFCQLHVGQIAHLVEEQALTPVVGEWQTVDGSEVLPLIEDSSRDSLGQEVGSGGDFVALYAAQVRGELWVSARLRGNASALLSYTCLCRGFNGRTASSSRVLFPVQAGRRPQSQTQGGYVLARFSLEELGNPTGVIVHFEAAYPGGRAIDRVGWAVASLSQQDAQ